MLAGNACFCLGGNGITVKAAVRAGIIAADISALNTSTGFSLPAVFFPTIHLPPGNTLDKFTIDTTAVHDAVL